MIFITKPKTVEYDVYRTAECVFMNVCLFIIDFLNLKLTCGAFHCHFKSLKKRKKPNETAICVVVKQD